jgi:DNA polymerase III subunit gamma/tau
MGYQVLARKYRPQRFADVVRPGPRHSHPLNALAQNRIAHGYIFSGHRGIGKTTIARILAMALNCRTEIGSAQRPTPEPCGVCDSCIEIRRATPSTSSRSTPPPTAASTRFANCATPPVTRPARDRYKIYILDEAHQITDAAFNALLKTLEEPPGARHLHDGHHAARGHSPDHPLPLPALQLSRRQIRRHPRPSSR